MRFPEAMYYALKIRKENPEFTLCGSVALILAGKMPVRDVHDIDFIAPKSSVRPNWDDDRSYHTVSKKENYKCYFFKGCDSPFKVPCNVNVFVFDDDKKINKKNIVMKISIENPDDILEWKIKYNREKDIEDIYNITE